MPLLQTAALVIALTLATGAQAQTTGAALTPVWDTTGVGQTKPPSRAASPTSRENPNRRSKNEQQQDTIAKGICIGCSPK